MSDPASDDTTQRKGLSRRELVSATVDAGGAVAGALVGLALGGPEGALLGAAAPPLINRAATVAQRSWARRTARVSRIVEDAVTMADSSPEVVVQRLETNDLLADDFFEIIQAAASTEPEFGVAFTTLMASLLADESTVDATRERVLLISDSIRGLRATHLKVLVAVAKAGQPVSPSDLSNKVAVPEIELRGVVRALEARGMIKDVGKASVAWKIRSLGRGVVDVATTTRP